MASLKVEVHEDSTLQLFAAAKGISLNDNRDIKKLKKWLKNVLEIEPISCYIKNPLSVKNLSSAVIDSASELHTHRFKSYTKAEAESALKFLELLSLLGFYKNQLLGLTKVGLREERENEDPLIEKALDYAEKIRDQLTTKKINRQEIINEIKELDKKISKIFSRRLESIDQLALRKYTIKALSILKSYAKN